MSREETQRSARPHGARLLLVAPWLYRDEDHPPVNWDHEWRNGPYNLLLLATVMRKAGHAVVIVDLQRELVARAGDVSACLDFLGEKIKAFQPDVIGFTFFSVHFLEAQKAINAARRACSRWGIRPVFVGGGIHATVEPEQTLRQLDLDLLCVGEAEIGLRRFLDGERPETIPGFYGRKGFTVQNGEQVERLDDLPFPDWNLCDHAFYRQPSYARVRYQKIGTLDMMMGRGCAYRCNFCAYSCLSRLRFHSAAYLADQLEHMNREYGVDHVYLTDSTVGNNPALLRSFCELLIHRDLPRRVRWLANLRADQADEPLLKLMQKAGCVYLFYGFESGSQEELERMNKKCTVEDNARVAKIHNRLGFFYNASMIVGYPGETERDFQRSVDFLREVKPPSIGVNWYTPLPGSADYARLKQNGKIRVDDPSGWRLVGEVSGARFFGDMPEDTARQLYARMQQLACVEIPAQVGAHWSARAPAPLVPGAKIDIKNKNLI